MKTIEQLATGYCSKCDERRAMVNPDPFVMLNGKRAMRGACPHHRHYQMTSADHDAPRLGSEAREQWRAEARRVLAALGLA